MWKAVNGESNQSLHLSKTSGGSGAANGGSWYLYQSAHLGRWDLGTVVSGELYVRL